MKNLQSGMAALSLLVAGAALAQAPAGTPSQMNPVNGKTQNSQFTSMDANKDGRISREEARTHADMVSSWDSLDADKDTYLSESEYGKYKAPVPGPGATGKVPPSSSSPQPGADKQ